MEKRTSRSRLEPCRGFEQADVTLLDQVGEGEAVMAEAGRERDDEAHVGGGEFVKGMLVALVAPALRQGAFLVPARESEPTSRP